MSQPGKRRGEQSDEGNPAKKPLHDFPSISHSGQAHGVSIKEMALPELVPYELVEDLTLVLPSQPFEVSSGFSKQRYARDLWTIFQEEALVDRRLDAMHQKWFKASKLVPPVSALTNFCHFKVRKPDVGELWECRHPAGEGAELSNKASTRQGVLRTVRTLELVLDQVTAQQMPELHLSLSRLHLDYIMLMCIIC